MRNELYSDMIQALTRNVSMQFVHNAYVSSSLHKLVADSRLCLREGMHRWIVGAVLVI
jgi:hypothetical protein